MPSTAVENKQESLFNGYTITFHCDYCGKNFPIAWPKTENMPKHSGCPYCGMSYSADKMYQDEKREIILFYINR